MPVTPSDGRIAREQLNFIDSLAFVHKWDIDKLVALNQRERYMNGPELAKPLERNGSTARKKTNGVGRES